MDTTEATRTCGQCHKEVAEANFALHETHCSRFLCICPDCKESVPRDQLDQHKEEQHTMVRCSKCNTKMERCQLMDHESDECVERLQSCQYCELDMPWKDLDEHSKACGSRTERCSDCNRYVTLKDQSEHRLTCSAADNGSGPPQTTSSTPNKTKITVNCSRCMASFPAGDIEEHELECFPVSTWYHGDADPKEEEHDEDEDEDDFSRQGATSQLSGTYKATSLSFRPNNGPQVNGLDPDLIATCPHCHLALPLITLRWHEAKCKVHLFLK
ncbi:XIAP-associated factor 1 [Scomber japonicus]|uniref:XIAP-associated factor 1 n=1 Tax=Scomber japonicus TaxID=13676 RepID=UPI002304DB8D|nr:XIAP-associated factor 1 [Scomber japonicus]